MEQAIAHALDGREPSRCAYNIQCLLVNVHEHSMISKSMKESISLDGIVTYAPYTPGIRHGQHFWLSGQIAIDGALDIKSQTEGALAKIDALLEAGGLSKNDVCFAQVLLDSIEDYGAMNEVYGAWVADMDMPPARAAFEAGGLPKGALVEIVVQGITS